MGAYKDRSIRWDASVHDALCMWHYTAITKNGWPVTGVGTEYLTAILPHLPDQLQEQATAELVARELTGEAS
jgi:hypothetical protein